MKSPMCSLLALFVLAVLTACQNTAPPTTVPSPVSTMTAPPAKTATSSAPTQALVPIATGVVAPASFSPPKLVDAAHGSLSNLSGKIVFFAGLPGDNEIYVADLNAWKITQLTEARGNSFDPDWSPDGTKIIFRTDRDGKEQFTSFESGQIYVMNSDGSDQTNLSNNLANDGWPKWSPDGTRIVFASYRDGRPNSEVYIMNADGSGVKQITNTPGLNNEDVAWSPDGRRIAFKSYRDGDWEIYVMNSDGTAQTRLTRSSGEDGWPSWSPDGKQIIFLSQRDNRGNSDLDAIYVMNADGTAQKSLTPAGGFSFPRWSPDGIKIAFYSERDGPGIYIMNADGSGITKLIGGNGSGPAWRQ